MLKAIAITGPTASGKTAISLALAKSLSAEIISCDSMQIYKGMDIGTAKATPKEREEAPHHMIDFISPTEDYSAEEYRSAALKVAGEITARGALPLFVGGTGLYVDALMRAPMTAVPESSREYRDAAMEKIKDESDVIALWERLRSVDPESAEAIHRNNVRRVIRALEIYDKTGKTKSHFDKMSRLKSPDIEIGMITLDFHDRDTLYARVDSRVDEMIKEGLVDEVRRLYDSGLLIDGSTASQAIGYKEMLLYIKGESTLSEAVELIKLSTRRYAKRQLTWFRHEVGAYRLFVDREDGSLRSKDGLISESISYANQFLKEFSSNEG